MEELYEKRMTNRVVREKAGEHESAIISLADANIRVLKNPRSCLAF